MAMDRCLISAIVPVYRTEGRALLNCIRKLAGQTERRIEILVIFDGERERYEEVLREGVFRDGRISLVEIRHAGVSAARNAGIARASGTWIFFADADDDLPPDAFERLLEGDLTADLIAGDYAVQYPGRTVRHHYEKEGFTAPAKERERLLRDVLNPQTGMGFCWGKLYRRSVIEEQCVLFDPELEAAEDTLFMLSFVLAAQAVCYRPGETYVYRISGASTVRSYREDYAERYELALRRIREKLELSGYAEALERALATCALYHLLLITVNYSFSPGRKEGRGKLVADYRALLEREIYAEALARGDASRFSLTRRISVWLIRHHFWDGVRAVARVRAMQVRR